MFNGKIHYKWPFSMAMLVYQRVYLHSPEIMAKTRDTPFWVVGRGLRRLRHLATWPLGPAGPFLGVPFSIPQRLWDMISLIGTY